jgi:hypothetical protein
MGEHQLTLPRMRWVLCGLLAAGILSLGLTAADDKSPSYPKPPAGRDVKVIPDAWRTVANRILTAAELDERLAHELRNDQLAPSPLTSDEQFLRRVSLDLAGKLPRAADVVAFVNDADPQKRSKLIDAFLASDDFSRHWARYWRDVIVARATFMQPAIRILRANALETWLFEELKANRSWAEMARAMITAEGPLQVGEPSKNGATAFLLCHSGPEAAVERAGETARVFLGVQIQCAQCHDHPNDIWKQTQFHEMAAFFARLRDRPIRDAGRLGGFQLLALPRMEHQMPDKQNPQRTTTMHPRFLTGEALPRGQGDSDRRQALADAVTAKDNYWFAAAHVNRVWGELMGQAFYQPVDNMGPLQEATYPAVLLHLAASFRASNYDIRELFRTIMNSQAYQRQIRLGESPDQHLRFAGAYPTRLRADALWASLMGVLGPIAEGPFARPARPAGARLNRVGLPGVFQETFEFDPSTRSDEVEGSVPQALLLMNNPAINARIRAAGNTLLARLLRAHTNDDQAIEMVYLHTLARKPSARELEICRDYVQKVNHRAEAFEDLLWSLINSTEFQTRR